MTRPAYWYPLAKPCFGEPEAAAVADVIRSGQTTMWDRTREYEAALAKELGAKHAVACNSGSSADLLVALALVNPLLDPDRGGWLRPSDEVLIPAVTWPTHVWAARLAGLTVRLIDVDPATLNAGPAQYAEAMERYAQVRAFWPVHLMGNPVDVVGLAYLARPEGIVIVADGCEAFGARAAGRPIAGWAHATTLSTFFSHQGAVTMEGGAVLTDDARFADVCRLIRAHGWTRNATPDAFPLGDYSGDPRYAFVCEGLNVRPTEAQAAMGLVQLGRWPEFQANRAARAAQFRAWAEQTGVLDVPAVRADAEPSWLGLPVLVRPDAPVTRDALQAHLEAHGVETRAIVAGNLARQPAARYYPELRGHFPGADAVHNRGLYVGLHGTTTADEIARVCETFEEAWR